MLKNVAAAALSAFLLSVGSGAVSAETGTPEVYAAFGDSLAAGQTPARAIDAGYADLIAQELSRNGDLTFYTKDFSFPGLTAGDVLERVQSPEAQELLEKATLITVSAGANDLLAIVQTNPASGAITFSQLAVDRALNRTREHISELLDELAVQAPQAEVFVMGYYFPYPHASDLQKQGLAKQLDVLNAILEREAEKAGVEFVPVADAFGTDAITKIPQPGDVHPALSGYQAMANSFFNVYEPSLTVTDHEMPNPSPVSFEKLMEERRMADGAEERKTDSAAPLSETEYITVSKLRHYT